MSDVPRDDSDFKKTEAIAAFSPTPRLSSTDSLIILDWDDSLMPSTYILSVIEYTKDPNTAKIKALKVKKGHKKELKASLNKVGVAAYNLLTKLLYHYQASQIKIVTNGHHRWLRNSLLITSKFSEQYKKIKQLLEEKQIECVYARNIKYHHIFWKAISYEALLSRMDLKDTKLNILTIGDQMTDHSSIGQTFFFQKNKQNIYHHQIKLRKNADCEHISEVLQYVTVNMLSIVCVSRNILRNEQKKRIFIKFS